MGEEWGILGRQECRASGQALKEEVNLCIDRCKVRARQAAAGQKKWTTELSEGKCQGAYRMTADAGLESAGGGVVPWEESRRRDL